ncbi:MAG: hypothetical protein U0K95_02350, partial [Eubacterium sp.]|nr:hypothetical protein [Eubacterium sp.]
MIKIKINSIEYSLDTQISLAEHKEIVDTLRKEDVNYKDFFVEFISKKINTGGETKITIDDIEKYCDLPVVIEEFIGTDEKLKVLYEQHLFEKDMYEAFFSAIHQKLDDEWKKITDQIPKIDTQVLSAISSFGRAIAKIVTSSAIQTLGKVLTQFYESIEELSIKIAKMVSEIKIPTISDERKQELVEAFKTWGSYGWTILP